MSVGCFWWWMDGVFVGLLVIGNFEIEWWGGVNFPKPAFQKKFNGLNPGEQKIFSFQYDGYKSWYGRITSKLVIDADNVVKESNESNNVLEMTHPVKKK